jgi:exopolyphosphatase/guanosine-5'-triphosphate,3'-diphosphate pyrophosphatase
LHVLPERLHLPAARATALLRLAVLLQRGRSPDPLPKLRLAAEGKTLQLNLPKSWLDAHPLTRADLEQERDYLKQLEIRLRVGELGKG